IEKRGLPVHQQRISPGGTHSQEFCTLRATCSFTIAIEQPRFRPRSCHLSVQPRFIEDDHMLEAFPSDRADDALDISPLQRGSRLELGSNPELFLIPQR